MNIAVISYLYILFIVLAFLADRLPFLSLAKNIVSLSKNSFNTIRSDLINDAGKEKLLLANSLTLLTQSLKIIAFIALLVACGLLLLLLMAILNSFKYADLVKYVITFNGVVLGAGAFLTYYLLKKLYVKIRL